MPASIFVHDVATLLSSTSLATMLSISEYWAISADLQIKNDVFVVLGSRSNFLPSVYTWLRDLNDLIKIRVASTYVPDILKSKLHNNEDEKSLDRNQAANHILHCLKQVLVLMDVLPVLNATQLKKVKDLQSYLCQGKATDMCMMMSRLLIMLLKQVNEKDIEGYQCPSDTNNNNTSIAAMLNLTTMNKRPSLVIQQTKSSSPSYELFPRSNFSSCISISSETDSNSIPSPSSASIHSSFFPSPSSSPTLSSASPLFIDVEEVPSLVQIINPKKSITLSTPIIIDHSNIPCWFQYTVYHHDPKQCGYKHYASYSDFLNDNVKMKQIGGYIDQNVNISTSQKGFTHYVSNPVKSTHSSFKWSIAFPCSIYNLKALKEATFHNWIRDITGIRQHSIFIQGKQLQEPNSLVFNQQDSLLWGALVFTFITAGQKELITKMMNQLVLANYLSVRSYEERDPILAQVIHDYSHPTKTINQVKTIIPCINTTDFPPLSSIIKKNKKLTYRPLSL